jgi:predicted GTPase
LRQIFPQFIRQITGNENIKIGHGQDSETNDIGVWEFFDKTTGRQVVLIDTPGFDDSRGDDPDADQKLSDVDILQMIVDFLTTEWV